MNLTLADEGESNVAADYALAAAEIDGDSYAGNGAQFNVMT